MLCLQPNSTSHTFLSSIHVVCMVLIQSAVPFCLPSMCVWSPLIQLYLSILHPCCVYSPHSTSHTFLSSIHVVYTAPFNQPHICLFNPCVVTIQQALQPVCGHHSTSCTFLPPIHLCMAPIQPALLFSLPSVLCIRPPFNQQYLSLFHPCFVYGPHSTSHAFLSFIHVLCIDPIQPAIHSSLPSMLCVRTHSTSRTFLFPIQVCMAAIQPAVPFSLPSMLCVCPHSTDCTFLSSIHFLCNAQFNKPYLPLFHLCSVCGPLNQPYRSLFLPRCVHGPHSTSRTILSSIHAVCMAPFQPAVTFALPIMLCVRPPSTSRTSRSFIHDVCTAPI